MCAKTLPEPRLGAHYAAADCGPLDELRQYVVPAADGTPFRGKIWVKELLGLSGMEFSLGALAPGQAIPFVHAHKQNEELYVFVSGEGEFSVDGEAFAVGAGSVVRVSPDGARCWRNTGEAELVYFVVQAKAGSLEQWTGDDGYGVESAPGWEDRGFEKKSPAAE
jgi:mannose-6-phosphate isomerase-like protein (cupin superfamily)